MNKNTIIRIVVYGSIICTFILYQYGRSLWYPVFIKVTGKDTVADIYERVGKQAETKLTSYFNQANIKFPANKITLIALKDERVLEVWGPTDSGNTLVHKYKFTGFSGRLGPKLKFGDNQIPEGVYNLEYLNPNSSYHLSMKIDYPNEFDRSAAKKEGRTDLGDDIFIHGKSGSIGCIPIGDASIEELFILVYRVGIDNVKVIIAPNDLRLNKPKYSNSSLIWLDDKYNRILNLLMKYK